VSKSGSVTGIRRQAHEPTEGRAWKPQQALRKPGAADARIRGGHAAVMVGRPARHPGRRADVGSGRKGPSKTLGFELKLQIVAPDLMNAVTRYRRAAGRTLVMETRLDIDDFADFVARQLAPIAGTLPPPNAGEGPRTPCIDESRYPLPARRAASDVSCSCWSRRWSRGRRRCRWPVRLGLVQICEFETAKPPDRIPPPKGGRARGIWAGPKMGRHCGHVEALSGEKGGACRRKASTWVRRLQDLRVAERHRSRFLVNRITHFKSRQPFYHAPLNSPYPAQGL